MGLSTMGSISLGCALVAGRKRVPSPAAGKTALRTFIFMRESSLLQICKLPQGRLGWLCFLIPGFDFGQCFLMDGKTGEQVVQFRQDFAGATGFQEELQNSSRRELRALVRGYETSQLLGIDLGIFMEADVELIALAFDATGAHALAKQSQSRVIHQAANRTRERAITVFEFA